MRATCCDIQDLTLYCQMLKCNHATFLLPKYRKPFQFRFIFILKERQITILKQMKTAMKTLPMNQVRFCLTWLYCCLDHRHDSYFVEKEKQSTGRVWSLESTPNGNPKSISPAVSASALHSYPPKLPKLVPLSSLRSFPVLNTDSKGNGGSTLLSHLNKIRMVNGNLLHQSMKPQVRLNPSPVTPSPSIGGPATHFQPRLLIFSSSSFLQNFSAPTMAMARPANPENLRIVLGKFQPPSTSSPSISKDSGIGSQSMPSLIMLSSAAEAAETASSQKVQDVPQASQAVSALNGPVPTSIVEVRNEPSVRNNEMTTSNVITTSITTTCVMPMVSAIAKTMPEKETQLDSGAQEGQMFPHWCFVSKYCSLLMFDYLIYLWNLWFLEKWEMLI